MRRGICWLIVILSFGALSSCAQQPPVPQHIPYHFENVTFIAGGFITGFVAHPKQRGLYYVRTDIGGAYRWDNEGKHWTPLQDWLPFSERNLLGAESFAIDPTDVDKLYIAAGTYINEHTPNGDAPLPSLTYLSRWAAMKTGALLVNDCRWIRTIRKHCSWQHGSQGYGAHKTAA